MVAKYSKKINQFTNPNVCKFPDFGILVLLAQITNCNFSQRNWELKP